MSEPGFVGFQDCLDEPHTGNPIIARITVQTIIDTLVYELYGLTEEGVRIAEKA